MGDSMKIFKWVKKLERLYNIKKVTESRKDTVNKIIFCLFNEKSTLETIKIYKEVEIQYNKRINHKYKEAGKEIKTIENENR